MCPKCDSKVEITLRIDDRDQAPLCCNENCNVEMKRVMSVSNFELKGGGWYKDGYSSVKK